MNEESASSPASPKPEHGSSTGVTAALETAPELVRLLPNADRFAGIGLLAVLTLFALALWQGPKTVTGEVIVDRLVAANDGDGSRIDLLIRADRNASLAHVNRLALGLRSRGVRGWRLATQTTGPQGGGA